mgnify:FL=1
MSVARDQHNDEMLEILHSAAASQFSRRRTNSAGHSGSTHSNGRWRPHPGESGVGESGMSAYESVTSAASGTEALAGDEGFPMSGMEAGGAFGTYLLYLRSRLLHLLTYFLTLLTATGLGMGGGGMGPEDDYVFDLYVLDPLADASMMAGHHVDDASMSKHFCMEETTFMAVTKSYLSSTSSTSMLHSGAGVYTEENDSAESSCGGDDENAEDHYTHDYPDELSSSGGEHGDDEDSYSS